MAIDVGGGLYGPALRRRAPDPEPALEPYVEAARAQEQAEEDAVFVASARARLAADQARAFREGTGRARETGGAGFAEAFLNGYRAQAQDLAARAGNATAGKHRPSDRAIAAFRAGAEADADALIDRAAMAETVARAERRQREGAAALDAIRQAAVDDPDGFAAAEARLDEMIGPLAPILDPDAPEQVHRNERANLAKSAVQGRIASSPEIAIRELDDPERFKDLPADQRASLREAAERRRVAVERDTQVAAELTVQQDALRRTEADHRFTTDFLARAGRGEAREAELEEAVDRGLITREKAGALRDARDSQNRQRAAEAERISTVQALIDAGGRLDPGNPIHIESIGSYWKQVLLPALRQQRPADLPSFIAGIAKNIGFVPEGAGRAMRAFWDSGDPERRIAVARTLLHIDPEYRHLVDPPARSSRDLLIESGFEEGRPLSSLFEPREIAVQNRALEFIDIGLSPEEALERAESMVPVEGTVRREDFTLLSGDPSDSGAPVNDTATRGETDASRVDTSVSEEGTAAEREPDQAGLPGVEHDPESADVISLQRELGSADGSPSNGAEGDADAPPTSEADADPTVARLAELTERLLGQSERKTGPTSGDFRRSADDIAAGFDEFEKNADELSREIGRLILELAPGVGEVMSAQDAGRAFTDAYDSIQRGDLEGAREELGEALLAAAGALPIVGKGVKLGKIALEFEHIAYLIARGSKKVKGRVNRTFNQPSIDDLRNKTAPERKLPPKVRAEVEEMTVRKDTLRKQREAWEERARQELTAQGKRPSQRELGEFKKNSQEWKDLVAESRRNDLNINKKVGDAYQEQMALELESVGYKVNRRPRSLWSGGGRRYPDIHIEGRGRQKAFVDPKSKQPRQVRKGEPPSRPDPPEIRKQRQRERAAIRLQGRQEKSIFAIEGKKLKIYD